MVNRFPMMMAAASKADRNIITIFAELNMMPLLWVCIRPGLESNNETKYLR